MKENEETRTHLFVIFSFFTSETNKNSYSKLTARHFE